MIYRKCIKRALDFIFSLIALILFWWLLLIISLVVLISDGWPIFYSQDRIGYKGKKFRIYKFRTMVKNADKIGALSTAPMDSRVTKVGRILRKLSLDELPQLLNILRGDMSIIGNRPNIYTDYAILNDDQKKRLEVLPGLTGLAAVKGRSLLTREEKLKYELEYVDKCSFVLDCKILFSTVVVVLTHKGVNSSIKK